MRGPGTFPRQAANELAKLKSNLAARCWIENILDQSDIADEVECDLEAIELELPLRFIRAPLVLVNRPED